MPTLPLPARVYTQANVVKTLLSMVQEPTPERTLALEVDLTKLASAADVERYLGALRCCPATARMLEERYLPAPYSLDDLERCDPGTLGHVYRQHMIENDLRPDYFAPIDPSDDFAYTRLRLYMTHDLWHVVTGYPTTKVGEMAIVGFYLGHFERHMGDRASSPAAFAAILAGTMTLHAALFRQDRITHFMRALHDGWARGQAAFPFFAERFEERWDEPLDSVRASLGVGASTLMRIEPMARAA